ncbi:feruloyl esterase B precursor [Exidia glandulosa HHB12029]|uniref:Carboxylic ester hydrolase n=1 Tax=Exidia glandulosa HHB12029 TaxID=1314781 RepID=A0A165QI28_EXIGL|nr:feruloyl esterase B precursor [Exidia glandulosa HHB12029]
MSAFGSLLLQPVLATSDCVASSFTPLLPSNASLVSVVHVPRNGSFGSAPGDDLEFPTNATGLPALCAVTVHVISSADSSFNFGLFLPTDRGAWNGRIMTGGNGGFAGGINWPDMGIFSHYGFASLSTDTGHNAGGFDASWALNQPESIIDWSFRAMHESVLLGKRLTAAFYNRPIAHSYYAGCSTGGRQGLKEVQMFPDDFDGIVVGAPAWWTSHLQPWTVEVGLRNLPVDGPGRLNATHFTTAAKEILRQCDPQDGVKDGIISDPDGCRFIPDTLLCTGATSTNCLTGPQLDTLFELTHDWVDVNQTFVFPHLALGADLSALTSGTAAHPAGTGWVVNFLLNDTEFDFNTEFDFSTVQLADAINPGRANADDFDMSAFERRGGKIIHYHGYADQLIPTGSSIYFRQHVQRAMAPAGTALDDFYRFFLIPGMGHCAGSTTAPWYIAGGSQLIQGADHGVPGFEDPAHDAILAIMAWVEHGKAPSTIIATKFVNDSAPLGVERQRPLCPYPSEAKFTGKGDVDAAESWVCVSV